MTSNQLTTFPSIITERLRDLNSLKLNRNRLQILPPAIAELRALTELDISDNQLQELPLSWPSSLEELNIDNNPLSGSFHPMKQLAQITKTRKSDTLKKIWRPICHALKRINPELVIHTQMEEQAIRTWMDDNLDLLRMIDTLARLS